jgi:hypothetical protein
MPSNNTYKTVWNSTLNALPQNERGYYKLSVIAAPNRQVSSEPFFRPLNVVANTVSPQTGHPWRTANIGNLSFSGQEVPAGIVNGINPNFTLAHGTVDPLTLTININDSPQIINVNYTVSGGTKQNIAFATAPANLSIIHAYYLYGS